MAMETMVVGAAICAALALVNVQRRMMGANLSAATVRLRARAHSMLHPYRPELHYMRGPGPKWHEKHLGAGRFD
ncbi:MAG TPA: hypothetical protein VGZ49_10670 [Xanthobacteraceae bacterium]|jgi:hypothetical protein|nr:hypothetical protein [Xanthobacteraceae bacterium]